MRASRRLAPTSALRKQPSGFAQFSCWFEQFWVARQQKSGTETLWIVRNWPTTTWPWYNHSGRIGQLWPTRQRYLLRANPHGTEFVRAGQPNWQTRAVNRKSVRGADARHAIDEYPVADDDAGRGDVRAAEGGETANSQSAERMKVRLALERAIGPPPQLRPHGIRPGAVAKPE